MDKKQIFNLENPQDVAYLLSTINDDMAVNSDAEGDSDADDDVPLSILASSNTSTRLSTSEYSNTENENENETRDGDEANAFSKEPEEASARDINEEEYNDDSSLTDSSDDEIIWSRHSQTPPFYKQNGENFSRPFGISKHLKVDISSPCNVFLCVLTHIFLQYIVEQSNLYAIQSNQVLDLTLDELKAYIGILIVMGFHHLPSMRLFWSGDPNFEVTRIKNVITLKRFLKITRCLHLNDNSCMPKKGEEDYDRLYKVKPFLEYATKRFKLVFHPSRFLSIDESMVKFKGRSSLKQYLPMKPIKRGFKMWVIACGVTGNVFQIHDITENNQLIVSGYCLGMCLYEGAEKDATGVGLGERVVLKLSTFFEGLGYCLFFDNFFSSIPLAQKLLEKKFFSCATIRQTRKLFPRNLLKEDKRMNVGETDGLIAGNIGISKWKDRGKKSVCTLSTTHNPLKETEVLRTQKTGERKTVKCPEAIADYNRYMGGVDHFDQLLSTYSISWKSRRWWMRIFYYLLDSCVVNSYIIYQTTLKQSSNKNKPMTHLQFRSVLATELIGSFCGRIKPGPLSQFGRARKRNHPDGRSTTFNAVRLNNVGSHLPLKGTRRRCSHCSTRNIQQRSNIICKQCEVALCLECFIPYHQT